MNPTRRTRDEWIALRCQAREASAFEELVAEMEQPLFYYARKLTGRDDRALDVLQEVWLKAFRGIHKLKEPGAVRPWLYRMTLGIAVDGIRQVTTRERAEEMHAEGTPEAIEPSFDTVDSERLHRALDELEPKHREALVLHFLEDFSLVEIAEIVGCPAGTVKSRLHYARQALKSILSRGEHGNEA